MSAAPPSGAGMPPMPKGPPYLPTTAGLGGLATNDVDTPISAVLLVFFILGAAFHMTIFQINRRRGHKFILSALTFGFCMARIAALTLRIVWASRPTNASVAIAANIFTAAGVLLLFIINLIFTQRLLRGWHPNFGWSRPISVGFKVLYGIVIALLIMVITVTVLSFYTLDAERRRICRDVQLFAGTFLAVLAFAPLPIVAIAWAWPRPADRPIEKFGTGRWRTKVALVLFTATLLALGAGFRAGIAYEVRPVTQPAWFHHKAAYYCFNYVIELIVVYTYGLTRFDQRFYVPDGAKGPGDYAAGRRGEGKAAADTDGSRTDEKAAEEEV